MGAVLFLGTSASPEALQPRQSPEWLPSETNLLLIGTLFFLHLSCLESQFAVRSDSNRHWFAAISHGTIRIARPKTVRIAGEAL